MNRTKMLSFSLLFLIAEYGIRIADFEQANGLFFQNPQSAIRNPQSGNSQSQTGDCKLENTTFQAGEEIVYKIYYNWNFVWAAAGEVTFRVYEEGQQYHFMANGKTYSSYEWFYKVSDDYDSWVDKNTLFPTYSIRSINEGSYTNYEKVSYSQAKKSARVWRAKKRGDPETETKQELKDCVHDLISVVYYMRNLDFSTQKPGDAVPIRVYLDKEEYPLNLIFRGSEERTKVHGMGRYRTLVFEPDVIAGNVFKEGDKMKMYVSNDANKIPLQIESPIAVGSVKMVLKSYKGLRYPFTAKVN